VKGRAVPRPHGVVLGVAVFLVALGVWEIWARIASYFLVPTVSDVAVKAKDVWPSHEFVSGVGASLGRLALGFAIGCAAAISLGLAMGSSQRVRRTLGPTTEFFRALPVIAVVPIAIVVLGVGDAMRVSVIAFGVFFPVLIATIAGVRAVAPEIRDSATLFRLNSIERSVRVYLPAALPTIFAGLRTALSIGLVLVVISELNGEGKGLGVYIETQRFLYNVSALYAGIVFLGLLGYALNRIFLVLERRILAWHYGAVGESAR
jgi:ABC-type nitrate/sulfonate/bicarbonate transport system permease component